MPLALILVFKDFQPEEVHAELVLGCIEAKLGVCVRTPPLPRQICQLLAGSDPRCIRGRTC
jgi:hypothetical protein